MFISRLRRTRPAGLMIATVALAAVLAGCGGGSSTAPSLSSSPNLTAAPTQVSWSAFQGVQVPSSRSDGPTEVQATGAAVGYSRTPQGAILAIEQGQVRVTLASDAQWPVIVTTTVAPGPGRDEFATSRVFAKITGPVPADQALTYAGYKFTSWTPDRADAQVVTRDPHGTLTVQPATVIWRGNDWKLLLRDSTAPQNAGSAPHTVTSLAGYTAFGPGGHR